MVIKWTKFAKQDLIDFYNTTKKTEHNAKKYIYSIVEYVENLLINPLLGKFLFHIDNIEMRQLVFRHHKIIYTVIKGDIFIISIVHTSRNIEQYMKYLKENSFRGNDEL